MLVLCLFIGTAASFAQSSVFDAFCAKVADSYTSFEYKFTVESEVKMIGAGRASVQGDAYKVTGSGLDITCDGKTAWYVDESAEEVLIDSVDPASADLMSNPALLVSRVGEAFQAPEQSNVSFQGEDALCVSLKPVFDSEIAALKLYFSKAGVLKGARAEMKDGIATVFTIPSISFSEPMSLSVFSFDESSVPETYIITDLR